MAWAKNRGMCSCAANPTQLIRVANTTYGPCGQHYLRVMRTTYGPCDQHYLRVMRTTYGPCGQHYLRVMRPTLPTGHAATTAQACARVLVYTERPAQGMGQTPSEGSGLDSSGRFQKVSLEGSKRFSKVLEKVLEGSKRF